MFERMDRRAYAYMDLGRGDYPRCTSRDGLVTLMEIQAGRIQNDEERSHFAKQVCLALAARAISSDHGDQLYLAAGLTKDGGWSYPS